VGVKECLSKVNQRELIIFFTMIYTYSFWHTWMCIKSIYIYTSWYVLSSIE